MSKIPGVIASGDVRTEWPVANRENDVPVLEEENSVSGQEGKDQVEFSKNWSQNDWTEAVKKVLEGIGTQYPSVQIAIDGENQSSQISDLAAGLGTGVHLVISQKFLDRMGSSQEEFGKCSSILNGIAKQLSGQWGGSGSTGVYMGEMSASTWSATQQQDSETEGNNTFIQASQQEEKGTDTNSIIADEAAKTTSFSVSRHYSKMGGARTKGQI